MTAMQIPEVDTLGQPTAPYTQTRTEWAVVIDFEIRAGAGAHHLGAQRTEVEARGRAAVWRARDARYAPRVIRREVVETAGEWEEAQ